jgi:hypothetical protein
MLNVTLNYYCMSMATQVVFLVYIVYILELVLFQVDVVIGFKKNSIFLLCVCLVLQEEFENTKGVIRILKSKKNRQHSHRSLRPRYNAIGLYIRNRPFHLKGERAIVSHEHECLFTAFCL